MYPIVKASGAYSPGSAGTSSTVTAATARTSSYTFTVPATAKQGDMVITLSSCDSGLPNVNCPVPSLGGHTFAFETYSGGDTTTGLHGAVYFTELQTDGAKTVTMTLPNGASNTADSAVIWLLIDGSSVYKGVNGFDPGWTRNTGQLAATTAHIISSQPAAANESPAGSYLAVGFLVNDASTSSVTYSYGAATGWSKLQEIGSREYLDSAIFTRTFDGETGFASVAPAYGASAVYARMNILIPGAPDFTVEHVASISGYITSGGRVWCDKPVGAVADDEPSTFSFTSQSTTRSRATIHRFRNVHPTRPLQLASALFGANTATAAIAHVGPDLSWQARSLAMWCWCTNAPNGVWNAYTPSAGMANAAIITNTAMEHLVGYRANPAASTATVTSGTETATYSVSNVWNSAGVALRAADTLASGVEVLIAFHTMDASQSSGTMATPDWGGWTLIGTLTRFSTASAANIKVYYKVVEAPKPLQWQALTDVGSTATDGLTAGYIGTQRQQPGSTNVSGPAPLAFEAAPFGRPGFAIRADIDAPPAQRAEHNPNHRQFINGDDYFFSFAFALPLGYPTWVEDFNVIEQIHAASDNGSPVVSFEVRDYSLRMRGGDGKPGASPSNAYLYNLLLLQNLRVGRWYHVVYRILFHEDPATTLVDVWIDGERKVTGFAPPGGTVYKDSIPAANGPGPSYRKQGIYKRTTIEGGGPGLQPWHAGSALGRSYAAVDPTRLHTPTTSPDLFPASA